MTKTTANEIIYKVNEVKNIMHENIEKATENCVKLESIDRTAEDLMKEAGVFQINAKKLKNKLWWKNIKIWVISAIGVIIVLGIIIAIVMSYMKDNKQ